MNNTQYLLLPESTSVNDFVDNPVFTDVTKDGEVYTTYRIVRFTHEIKNHHDDWTHLANVTLEFDIGIGVAFLRIRHRVIEDSRIKPAPADSAGS